MFQLQEQLQNRKNVFTVFILFWGIRTFYWIITSPVFGFMHDSDRYIKLSNQILAGNFDMDVGAFLTAPLYPWLLAIFKYLFGNLSLSVMSIFQITLESIAGLFLLQIAYILFGKIKHVSTLVIFLYALSPITFYYCYAIGQESIFQSTLIIASYFFIKTLERECWRDLVYFSIFFSFSFLTKSHILLVAPFFIFIWFWQSRFYSIAISKTFGFLLISLIITFPNSLYNFKKHKIYAPSSDGLSMFLYYGNSEFAYRLHLKDKAFHLPFPDSSSSDRAFQLLSEFIYFEEYNSTKSQKRLANLPSYSERHQIYLQSALVWIENNVDKWIQLKIFSVFHFIVPGINKSHASLMKWLTILFWSMLLYGFGYYGLWHAYKIDKKKHLWAISLIVSLFFFAILFGLPNRFRVITFEPFILIYAAFGVLRVVPKVNTLPLVNKLIANKSNQ